MLKMINKPALLGLALVALAFKNADAQLIPLDRAVRTGKLANGFTYYIRKNNEPQKRVQLYLVNKVGSVLEDDDQQGLAHFMEHMNFNGTKHYPKNDLVDYLQKAGIRFGADLNAYTSFDETVYELPVPTDDPAMTYNGLKIIRDWAQEAMLDPAEINKERGVVLEEERLGKGAGDRMSRKYYPVMLNHSRYAQRIPIGLDKVLTTFKPEVIKRFHHDWYRPDLQALIVVGDVNVEEVEKQIKAQFSDLKNPTGERPRTQYSVPLTGHRQFLTVTDKEQATTAIEILCKNKAQGVQTEADYLALLKRTLFNQLFAARRYAEISRQSNPAFVSMSAGIQGLPGGVDMFAFDVDPKKGRLEQGFEQAWMIVERMKRYGFTPIELELAKQRYLAGMEQSLKEKDKTSSSDYVKEYQNLFLHNEAAPGIAWEYAFTKAHIGAITLSDISSIMNDYLGSKDVDMLVLAPESEKGNLPDSAALASWIKDVEKSDIKSFQEEQVTQQMLLTEMPKPGKVTAKKFIAGLDVTELTLSNGIKVILKPTGFKNDEVRFTAFSSGGTSLYDDADYDNAANAGALISSFGVNDMNPVQLQKILNGKILSVAAGIGPRSANINGKTSLADLETALQLVYLQFTKPRKDSLLFSNMISNANESLANRYANPNNVFSDTINYVMGNYSYRAAPATLARLDRISMQRAYQIYKERFADASGFTFTFVGNFKADSITPLLEQYLGSLPSLNKKTQARDLGMHIPAGQLTKKVYKGTEEKALVRLVFSGDYSFSPLSNLELKALGDILQIKILQHLRENESEVYSPTVQSSYNKNPRNRYAIIVAFGCAPKNVDHLIEMVQQEMMALKTQGAAADDIEKFKASYAKSVELSLKDNGFWLSYLSNQYENNEDILQIQDMGKNLTRITPESLKEAAGKFLTGENLIRFELLPEK
jgi:zinc protease